MDSMPTNQTRAQRPPSRRVADDVEQATGDQAMARAIRVACEALPNRWAMITAAANAGVVSVQLGVVGPAKAFERTEDARGSALARPP